MPVAITAVYAALLALLLTALAINVTVQRNKQGVLFGDGGKPAMMRAMRMHGNSVEYMPIGVLLMGLYELDHGVSWVLHAIGIALIVGRLIYVAGIRNAEGPSAGRAIGVGLTWLTIIVVAALNLWQVWVRM
jgi:uncharacterized membrane protein YecN with MAPEG domain